MPKSDIHPKWFEDSQILCDGKPLCLIGSTKCELQIDIWLATILFIQIHRFLLIVKGELINL